MATSLATAQEMGFAEFASTLISETLNAVVTSILTQEKQAAQLEQQALQSPDEYAKENLTGDMVRAEVLRLFPSTTDDATKSSVDEGQPYSTRATEETPAILKKVDYKITKTDLTVGRGRTTINATGYAHIFAATKTALANQHLAVLKAVVARGIPRVYVDNGHITSKLTLNFQQGTTTTNAATTGAKIAGSSIRRITAQPVNANRPEYLSLKADVLSEIEITFKTVVP
jgi:hypothetical protein